MSNEQTIWSFLMAKLKNPYGAAAVMGNFYIESKLNPAYLQSSYSKKLGMTSAYYTSNTDSGHYSMDEFVHDKAGYGLAQWTYWSRKLSLYDYAKEHNASIGDLNTQLEFFWQEVQSYTTALSALTNATGIKGASDTFAVRYEKPSDTSDTALKRRSDAAQKYYDMFMKPSGEKRVRVTADNVNVRVGPGKDNASMFRAKKGDTFRYFGTDDNGWNGIVMWLHPDYSEVIDQ